MANQRVAVIGAGLAGAAAARALSARGFTPVLFDKGRGPGGRLSTRRADTEWGEIRFDHGAQFLTAEGDSFSRFLTEAQEQGAAAQWEGRVVSIDRGGNAEALRARSRWVGTPAMNTLIKHALKDHDVSFAHRAIKAKGGPGKWMIHFEDGSSQGPFHALALTLPPEQLIDFLARSDGDYAEMITEAIASEIAPCWAVMCVPETDADLGFDGAKLLGGALRWMARNNSRPGRSGPDGWVLHASPDWSRAFIDSDPETVARMLTEEAFIRFGLPTPKYVKAHRWLYALVETAPCTAFALDDTGTVGCAGDWRLGGRAECGWDSGEALGESLQVL